MGIEGRVGEFSSGAVVAGRGGNIVSAAVLIAGISVVFAPLPALSAETGIASIFYSQPTACGSLMNEKKLQAAHKNAKLFPCGSVAKVTSKKTGKSVLVHIVDRGPFVKGRIIDLSPAAFLALGGSISQGLMQVIVEREH